MADESHITLRACSKCDVEKPATVEHFANYRDRGKIRQKTFCRDCERSRLRAYRAANPERAKEWDRRNQERNRGAGSDYEKRRYARRDKAKAREDLERWKAENPDKARAIEASRNERIKEQRRTDPAIREKLNKKSREWRSGKRRSDPAFRDACNERTREWHAANKDRQNAYKKRMNAARRRTDIHFKLASNLRGRIIVALKKSHKSGSAVKMLGCSIEAFRRYIEKQFQPGMTWENWGRGWGGAREWHLDHVKPLASFDLSDPRQFAEACHFTNLQPLWAKDNLAKGAT